MPSKLLIAAANAAHGARHVDPFGVHIDGPVRVDGREVMHRVRYERDRFVRLVVEGVEAIPAANKLRGHARFVSDKVLQVGDDTTVQAESVVVATGARPHIPDMFRSLGDRMVTTDDIFYWDDLPKRVVVFGPGLIGLEVGQALHRLGVHIRMFGTSGALGGISDPKVRSAALAALQDEFYLDPDARDVHIHRIGEEVEVHYTSLDNEAKVERFDYALVATGREPNVDELHLSQTRAPLNDRGVPEFDRHTLQSGDTAIFIAGDAAGDAPLLHEASDEGTIAGRNAAFFPQVEKGVRRAALAIAFSDPQIARVGPGYAKLGDASFVIGAVDFADQGRSRVKLKNRGLLHVYAERGSQRLLGAEMVGPDAEHVAHLLAWALQQELTIPQILSMPFYHPTVHEGMRTALRDAFKQLTKHDSETDLLAGG